MGSVILLTAGKDGCGRTTVAANLAVTLARTGAKTALVDLNTGMRGLDLALGMQSSVVYDLGDFFRGEATLEQVQTDVEDVPGLSLYSCSQDPGKGLPDAEQIQGLYKELKNAYDFVIADGPAGPVGALMTMLSDVDRAVLVVTQNPECIRNAEAVNALLRAGRVASRRLLINQVKPEYLGNDEIPGPEEIVDRIRIPLLGILPYDDEVHGSAFTGKPVTEENGYFTETFRKIALELI